MRINAACRVIEVDGSESQRMLPRDATERLTLLNALVGGRLEAVPMPDQQHMVVCDHAEDIAPCNVSATRLAHAAASIGAMDYIAGCAVVVPTSALE
jgi:hypothetical protein